MIKATYFGEVLYFETLQEIINFYYSYKFTAKNPHACVWDESRFSFT